MRISRRKGHARAGGAGRDRGETALRSATIALAWTDGAAGDSAPLASATSVEQLNELTAAMDLTLTPGQIARLNAASAEAAGLAFLSTPSAATVIASVAVEITVSASGAQNGLCSEGSWACRHWTASQRAWGTPPTQKIRLSMRGSASQ